MDEEIRKIISKTTPADFDGHTEFSNMTPDQRLPWLDAANAVFLELHALARPELRVAEETPEYGSTRT